MPRTTKNPRTARITLRVPPATKERLAAQAAAAEMTLTEWLLAAAEHFAHRDSAQ